MTRSEAGSGAGNGQDRGPVVALIAVLVVLVLAVAGVVFALSRSNDSHPDLRIIGPEPTTTSVTTTSVTTASVTEPAEVSPPAGGASWSTLGVFTLEVGDCAANVLEDEVASLDGVPCGEPHQWEVYHLFDLPEGDGGYRGDGRIRKLANNGCLAAFEPFVGETYEASIFGFTTLTPSEGTWTQLGDREVVCMVGNYDGTLKTGSAEGAGL